MINACSRCGEQQRVLRVFATVRGPQAFCQACRDALVVEAVQLENQFGSLLDRYSLCARDWLKEQQAADALADAAQVLLLEYDQSERLWPWPFSEAVARLRAALERANRNETPARTP